MHEFQNEFFPAMTPEQEKQVRRLNVAGAIVILAVSALLMFSCENRPAFAIDPGVQSDPVDLIACKTVTIDAAMAKATGEGSSFSHVERLTGTNAKKMVAAIFGSAPASVSDVVLLASDEFDFVRVVIFENGCGVHWVDIQKDELPSSNS